MTQSRTNERSGFTIIELLVYMVIATVAIVTITGFMVDVIKYAAGTKAKKEVQQNSRLVMSRISQDIRNARSIQAIALPPNNHQLDLVDASGKSVTYLLADTSVTYNDHVNPISTLTGSRVRVVQLDFQNQTSSNSNEVTITLTIAQQSASAPANQQYSETLSSTIVRRQSLY